MSDFKKIAEEALRRANKQSNKKTLNESLLYPDGLDERMNPKLEDDIVNSNHSLGKHPIFPEGDEHSFEQKIMGKRFNDVIKRYKKAYNVDSVNETEMLMNTFPLIKDTMSLEKEHKEELVDLAIKMVRDEYDMGEDVVEIHAELVPNITLVGTKKNPKPITAEMEFNNHDEISNAKDEVYKRRFLNAMIQGASKKCNHMFHISDEEITNIEPKLMNNYSKLMASADLTYYVIKDMDNGVTGGMVKVIFPTKENPKAIIHVQAMVFPVLIHELVKGVMELLSAHGLPKDSKLGKFVIDKADYLSAEPWDMRIGPALWEQFTNNFDSDDFHLKHHVYAELASLPVKEFNYKMREIMANTKEGKDIIKSIVNDVKNDLIQEESDEVLNNDNDSFDLDDLLGRNNRDNDDDDKDDDGGFNLDDLFK